MSQQPYQPPGPPPRVFGRPATGPSPYPVRPGTPPYPVLREHPQGTTVLVFGVLGLFLTPLGFVAWYLGSKAEQEMEISGQYWSNAGSIRAGRILGMVTGILTIVSVAFMMVMTVLMLLGFAGLLSALR